MVNIVISTELGIIEAELYPQQAPVTVANFLANVAVGLYEGGHFYRAALTDQGVNGEKGINVIEAAKAKGKQDRAPIIHETNVQSNLLNSEGVLSMSRIEPGTATSGFFINVSHNKALDFRNATEDSQGEAGYVAFGLVTQGMEVVHAIHQSPKGDKVLTHDEMVSVEQLLENQAAIDRLLQQLLNHPIQIHCIEVK